MKLLLLTLVTLSIATAKAQINTTQNATNDSIYTNVQIEPQFPGGASVWAHFLNNYKLSPAIDSSSNTATVSFLVNSAGHISSVKIENAEAIDKKFLRNIETMVKKMPYWKSAVQNGKNVAFWVTKYITQL